MTISKINIHNFIPSSSLFLIFVILVNLSGCVTHPYPKQWGGPQQDLQPDGCAGLVGLYADRAYGGAGGLFAMTTMEPGRSFDFIEISNPQPGTLKFTGYNGLEKRGEIIFSEQDNSLLCEDDGALLKQRGFVAGGPAWGYEFRDIVLRKDTAANLAVRLGENAIVFFGGFVPIPWSEAKWYGFWNYACDKKIKEPSDVSMEYVEQLTSRARNCYWYQDFSAAIDLSSMAIQAARKIGGNTYEGYIWRSNAWYRKKEFTRAISDASEAIKANSKGVGAYIVRGYANFVTGNYASATSDFNESLRINPEGATIVMWRYFALARTGRLEEGKSHLNLYEKHLNHRVWPAPVVDYLAGRIDQKSLYTKAADSNPLTQAAHECDADFAVGERYFIDGNYPEARVMLTRAVKECQEYSESYAGAAAELMRIPKQMAIQ